MVKKLSFEQELEIVEMYKKDESTSLAQIAKKYKVGTRTIKRILERHGVELKVTSNKLSYKEEKEIIELYLSNKKETLTSLGEQFEVSRGTIKRVLKKNDIEIEYDRNSRRNTEIDTHSQEIVRLFVEEQWSRNKIAKEFNTSHIVIRRILVQSGCIEDNYFKGTNRYKLESMAKNLRKEYEVDIAFFESLGDIDTIDVEKLMVLNDRSKRIIKRVGELIDYKSYIRKFYFDEQFNAIYNAWKESGKNKWLSPSIDHKVPLVKGGDNVGLDNLQFITWFENRAKCDMTESEWREFKEKTNTKSDYFIRR